MSEHKLASAQNAKQRRPPAAERPDALPSPASGEVGSTAEAVRPGASLKRSTTLVFGARVVAAVVGLATSIATARLLGPHGRGVYVLTVLAGTIALTATQGTTASVAHFLGRAIREDQPKQPIRADSTYASLGLALIICLVALPVGVITSGITRLSAVSVAVLALTGAALATPGGDALAEERPLLLSATMVIPPVGGLVGLVAAIVVAGKDVTTAVAAWLIGSLVAAIVVLWADKQAIPRQLPSRRAVRQAIFGLQSSATQLVSLLNYRIDLLLLGAFNGTSAVGRYSIAVALAQLVWFVGATLATAGYGRIGRTSGVDSAQFTMRLVRLAFLASVVIGAVLLIAAPLALRVLFGAAYTSATATLRILVIGTVAYSGVGTLSAYFTNQLGRPTVSLWLALLSAAVTTVACVALIPILGSEGAGLASSIGYVTTTAAFLGLFARITSTRLRDCLIPTLADVRRG